MSTIDARALGETRGLEADVCIVGGGAAGLTLASELAGGELDVILLEAGGRRPDPETQALHTLDNRGHPIRENFMSRARYLGGSCNLWAGRSMWFAKQDVAARDWVPGSGWPIPHAEIARWYPRASALMDLPPVSSFAAAAHESERSEAERRLFEDEGLVPTVSLWAPRPKRFRSLEANLRRARTVRVLLHANVTRISLDEAGRAVRSVEASTVEGLRFDVRARWFVLACGGLENARLLLVSRDVQERGIGNRYDIVGRYFMDHPRAVYGRVRLAPDARLALLAGVPLKRGQVQFGVGLAPNVQRREGLLDPYLTLEAEVSQYVEQSYQSFVQTMKILLRRGHVGSRWPFDRSTLSDIPGMVYLLTPKELMPHAVFRWYRFLRQRLRPVAGGTRVVVYFCEQPPDPESRVTLSDECDRLGVQRLALHWRVGPEVTRSVHALQERLARRLAETGLGTLEPGEGEPAYTDASHHMGTTRMSHDPRQGVVDADCRVHGVDNLFVAGSSVFPCARHKNPTLTIVALTLRLADRLRSLAVG